MGVTMTDNKQTQSDNTEEVIAEALSKDEFVEVVSEDGKPVVRKGVYLLPNLFTTGALFGGFLAIIYAFNGNFAHAALAIFAAQILDGFDGRVARMTKTESVFGTEYDSLSDMVSFGLAPAVVLYSWALKPLDKLGLAAAFVFVACAALRLARFNTQASTADKRYFTGLASPPAATLMASGVWWGTDYPLTLPVSIFAAVVTAMVGLLMVSNIRYLSFKGLDGNRRVPFVTMLIVTLVMIAVVIQPRILFVLAFTYAVSGPIMWLWGQLRTRRNRGETSS